MKIAGLDIGTTGCKCTVFDEQGKYIDKAYRDYPVKRTVGGHEIDISVVMDAVFGSVSEMAEKYPGIAGIGVTSFGETFVCVDEEGNPLHSAMLYTDLRGKEECQELIYKLGEKKITNITGLRPHEMYSISKIMWIKKHCPDVYQSTKKIFLMEDYVVYHLTGRGQIDYSLASRTMAFDIKNFCWSKEIFEAAGINIELMAEPVPTGTVAGTIKTAAMVKTGLSQDTLVVSVSHDQIAAAVGAGAFDASVAVDGAGTVECVTQIFDSIPDMNAMYDGYFSIVPYVIPGKYAAYAFSYTGGALIQWCINTIAKKEKEIANEKNCSVNTYLENEYRKKRGDSPSDLLVLPHFAGAATPYMDIGSKGAVLGLTTDVTAAEIYRGCMEGVVYEMYLNIQQLKSSGSQFDKMHATGGGAYSKEWMQMKADMLDLPITALKTADAGTVGCAMMTGVAIGVFKDLEDAATNMVKETQTFYPRKELHEKYMQVYERYKNVYQAVRPLIE